MNKIIRHRNNLGQSLVELIVAIAIIQVGVLSVWSLFFNNFNTERELELRIIGANLSREAVELVKNLRDSNWLKIDRGGDYLWDDGLKSGSYTVSYDEEDLKEMNNDNDGQLYQDSQGFYTTSFDGTKTSPFKRIVILKPVCCRDDNDDLTCDDTDYIIKEKEDSACDLKIGLDVIAKTTWIQGGKERSSIVEDIIYNWR